MKVKKTEEKDHMKTETNSAGPDWSRVWSDGRLNTRLERRAHERIPSQLQARFFLGNNVYAGTITDLSEKGMFISTDIGLPLNGTLEILLKLGDRVVNIPSTIKRSVVSEDTCPESLIHGMGVELISSPKVYLEYIDSLKVAAQSQTECSCVTSW